MYANSIPNRRSPSCIHGVEVVYRICSKDNSEGHMAIVAYFWPYYNRFLDSAECRCGRTLKLGYIRQSPIETPRCAGGADPTAAGGLVHRHRAGLISEGYLLETFQQNGLP